LVNEYNSIKPEDLESIQNLLNFRVKYSGTNLPTNLSKVIEIARVLLRQPDILFLNKRGIDISGLQDKYFIETIFKH